MSEILSQDEVNALLQGVADGAIPSPEKDTPKGAAPASVRMVDVTQKSRSLRGLLPGLELVVERFTRNVRSTLATFFGQLPAVSVLGLDLIQYNTFLARLPRPVSLQLFKLTPLRGQGAVVVTPGLVGAVLQVFFGGPLGRKAAALEREYSPIEQRMLERLAGRILGDLREAWRPVEPLECPYVRAETNPLFATICGPDEVVVVIELGVELEGIEGGGLSVCIPNTALEPVRPRLAKLAPSGSEDAQGPDPSWTARLREALSVAEVEVSAELGTSLLPMRQVLNLQVGDVIPLGTGREGPVLLRIEGRPGFLGAPGISGGNNAVRVSGRA
jgi:flagellar motor switch protein FliM